MLLITDSGLRLVVEAEETVEADETRAVVTFGVRGALVEALATEAVCGCRVVVVEARS